MSPLRDDLSVIIKNKFIIITGKTPLKTKKTATNFTNEHEFSYLQITQIREIREIRG
jgi:hypothetical protein